MKSTPLIRLNVYLFWFSLLCSSAGLRAQETPGALQDMSYLKEDVGARKQQEAGIAEIKTADGRVLTLENVMNLSELNPDAVMLTLQHKQLTTLDPLVMRLTKLEILDVSHNQLTDIDTRIFGELRSLKKVYVNKNKIPDAVVDEWRIMFPGIRFYADKDIYLGEYPK